MVQFLLIVFLSLGWASAEPQDPELPKPKDVRALNPEMRLRLWDLSQLPPDQLKEKLNQWPHFQKMTPDKQDQFLHRIEEVKTHLTELALAKAKEYGLEISASQQDEFVKKYIQRRLEEEKKIWDQMNPLREKMEADLKLEMQTQFGGK